MTIMLAMTATHTSMRHPFPSAFDSPFVVAEVNGSTMLVDSAFWDSITFPGSTMNRRMYDLPRAEKPRSFSLPSWQSLAGFNTFGDSVLDPSELPQRQLSPIGSRRIPHRPPLAALAPVPQRTQARPLPKPPTVVQAQGNRATHPLPARPSSAPPRIQRIASVARVQEVEKIVEVPEPLEDAQGTQTTVTAKIEHPPSECQGDPLCPTHRKRPARETGPHKRAPLQLYESRPKFGSRQCNDFDCTGRGCMDCKYLINRGGSLWAQLARPMIEDKLEDISLDSAYAEDTLALLRFRATFQVRRSMML
ncbi:hypothetical protein VTO73DRAFT_8141 [Trametes versicolor]